MKINVEAIYEDGVLRPTSPLALPEHARVRVAVDDLTDEPHNDERAEWLAQSERRLTEVWNNQADDVFNELLSIRGEGNVAAVAFIGDDHLPSFPRPGIAASLPDP